ncbi:MAG TPA: 30S ribosomal protein S8e [Thermoplasmatales archaeon]|nr:30S ribosomal protein S8e [Thermoplasmatales archaeon]
MKWQGKSRRKATGGRLKMARKKRRSELGREPHLPMIGEQRHKKVRIQGGHQQMKVLSTNRVNVTDPATQQTKQVEIRDVLDNPANPHYVRRNILTKGAIIDTEMGKAKITSRPGQDGCINAVLLKDNA